MQEKGNSLKEKLTKKEIETNLRLANQTKMKSIKEIVTPQKWHEPPQGEGCRPLESPLAFPLLLIFYNFEVDTFGPYRFHIQRLYKVLEMRQERVILLRKALDGLDLQFSSNTSSCPSNKSVKPTTWNAPNVPNKMLKA